MQQPQASELEFLKNIGRETRLSLVGPMFKGRYRARFPTIYVDRGADFSDFPGAAPSLRIGDGDSASSMMDILLPREKDKSDLACALDVIPEQVTSIELHGFLGGRHDHELIGLGEVNRWLCSRPGARADFDGEKIIALGKGSWNLNLKGVFSIVSFVENSVCLTGNCTYPIAAPRKLDPVSSLGLSNIGSGDVAIQCAAPLFVYCPGSV